jgi:hypothetical protein
MAQALYRLYRHGGLMNKKSIEKILKLLDIIKNNTNFTEEELLNTEDNSVRWLFWDIKKECENILERENNFKKILENDIHNFFAE